MLSILNRNGEKRKVNLLRYTIPPIQLVVLFLITFSTKIRTPQFSLCTFPVMKYTNTQREIFNYIILDELRTFVLKNRVSTFS